MYSKPTSRLSEVQVNRLLCSNKNSLSSKKSNISDNSNNNNNNNAIKTSNNHQVTE